MDITTQPNVWTIIILVVIATIGNLQWLKGMFKKVDSTVWSIVAIAMCFGLYAISEYVAHWIVYAFVATAFMQLGYEIILQSIPAIIKKIFNITE